MGSSFHRPMALQGERERSLRTQQEGGHPVCKPGRESLSEPDPASA